MKNEQTNKTDTQGIKTDLPVEGSEPVSIVDEARGLLKAIKTEKEELKTENDRKQKLQAEELLSSNTGGHVEATPAKEETAKEYADKVMKNEIKE